MPHARVARIDTSAAAAMPGVKAILTVDDLPQVVEGANLGEGIIASTLSERGLTNEPLYEGEPILAVAAVDELTAAEAIEKIQIEYEPLPFVVDPVESLRPGSPNARTQGNVWVRPAPPPPGSRPGAAPPSGPEGPGTEVDRRGFRRGQGWPAPARQAHRRVAGRRPRGRLQAGGSRPRRNVRRQQHQPSAARNAHGDGLLAERQALHALLDAERDADRRRGGALGRHRAGQRRDHQRVHRRRVRQQGIVVGVRGGRGAACRRRRTRR